MKFLILFCISLPAHAVFHDIYNGYKKSNRLKAIHINQDIMENDFIYKKIKYDWQLQLSLNQSDSFLASLYSFSNQQTITQTSKLSLQKDTFNYGTFSLAQEQTTYDLSNWSSGGVSSFNSDKLYETKYVLTYQYEFLNKTKPLDWDYINLKNESDIIGQDLAVQKDYYDFFQAYNAAKLKIMLDGLYKEFEVKAKKRVQKLTRRTRDGLSRSDELDQARISLLTQQETIYKNENELRESVAVIEDVVGFPLPPSQYHRVKWSYKKRDHYGKLFSGDSLPQLEQLVKANRANEKLLLLNTQENTHSLKLNLSYSKNAFDESQSESLDTVYGDGKNDEKIIALTYTIPLSLSKRKAKRETILANHNKLKLDEKNLKSELDVQIRVLYENVERFEKMISLLERKVKVTKRLVKKQQKLYDRGQVSFEELLRSEESEINARLNLVTSYAGYESTLAKLAYFHGNIIQFLNRHKD